MTQENKELLLKDLCARLPYGTKIHGPKETDNIVWELDDNISIKKIVNDGWKPYLRPMSSMTDEEKKEYVDITSVSNHCAAIDWLLKNHFDYRGLIDKGLALEALEGMYSTKTTCNDCKDKNYCSQSEYVKTNCCKLKSV